MSFHKNSLFQSEGPKMSPFSLGSCCYKQIIFCYDQVSSSCKPRRRASQGALATLGHRKAPRGDPSAGASTRWSSSSNAKKHCRRTSSTIHDSARKDLGIACSPHTKFARYRCKNTRASNITPRSLSVSQRRPGSLCAPCDALRHGLQLDDAWS